VTQTQHDTVPQSETVAPQKGGGRFVRSAEGTETRAPRPRHEVPFWARPFLRLFFRYSYSRDAWVLLGIGDKHGPVIRGL
jgi:hypothetical protein